MVSIGKLTVERRIINAPYRISAKDKAFVLYDANLPEIRGIVPAAERVYLALEPFANLAYVHLDTDGFTEKGDAAALKSGDDQRDAWARVVDVVHGQQQRLRVSQIDREPVEPVEDRMADVGRSYERLEFLGDAVGERGGEEAGSGRAATAGLSGRGQRAVRALHGGGTRRPAGPSGRPARARKCAPAPAAAGARRPVRQQHAPDRGGGRRSP